MKVRVVTRGAARYKLILNEETGLELNHGEWAKYLDMKAPALTYQLKTWTIEEICRGDNVINNEPRPYRVNTKLLTSNWGRTLSNADLRIRQRFLGVLV